MYMRYTLDDVKKSSDRKLFNVVSLFAGGGGSSTGYKLAGGEVLLINEFQEIATKTYLANYPNTKVMIDDIRDVSGQDILDSTGLSIGELDILDGSPPCPPFSASGTKRKGWKKTKVAYGKKMENIEDLSFDMVRICEYIKPKVFICENVKGITHEYAMDHFNRIMNSFEGIGYNVSYRILNAADYDVPQKRQRVFIIGIRDDVAFDVGISFMNMNTVFPEPTSPRPTIREAIYDLLDDEDNMKEAQILCDDMKTKTKYEWMQLMPKDIPVEQSYVSVGDFCFAEMERRYKQDQENNPKPKNSHYQSRRTPWDLPSHTLSELGLQTSLAVHLHPREDRGYTTTESKRLMTLPEDFKLMGTLNEKLARVGLMVAPMQIKYIAENIYQQVLVR